MNDVARLLGGRQLHVLTCSHNMRRLHLAPFDSDNLAGVQSSTEERSIIGGMS